MIPSPRKRSVEILMNIDKNDAYINIEMNRLRLQGGYSSVDLRFIGQLVNGVIKHKLSLDFLISKYSRVKINKISPFVLAVLRSGIYQILYMNKVPDSAAVNESVKIIKKSSVSRLSGYVNAILRAVDKSDLEKLDLSDYKNLSIYYSFPLWMVERWIKNFGFEFTHDLLKALNDKPELYVRKSCFVNEEKFFEALSLNNVECHKVNFHSAPDFDCCFNLGNIGDLKSLKAYKEAMFYIQDPAAAFAAYLVGAQCGNTIIDVCSAPGGKSVYIAEIMNNCGRVISCDIYEHKLELIKENAKRYKIEIIEPTLCDATVFNSDFSELADCVLCDVPCSGLGIIRKKPDIKYARNENDIESLSKLSLEILNNASHYLKPGGTLVFSTCTIEAEENEDVIKEFLFTNRDFIPYPFDGDDYYKTFYPNIHNTDGFFVCRLKKALNDD